MEINTLGITYALISTASWALCAIILKKLGEKLDPIGMTTVKSILSTFFLLLVILITGRTLLINKEYLLPIIISGILGISIGDSFFFASLNRLSPMVLSLILFVGPDLFTGVFGLIFLGEMPSIVVWIGIIAILTGLGFFIFPIKEENKNRTTVLGLIFALLSLCCMAYSMVIIKPVLVNIPTITATMYRMFASAVILIIFGLISKQLNCWKNVLSDKNYDIKLTGTIGLATFGGFLLSLAAIKYCDLIVASTLMSLEPLFIMIFMILFNKYKPTKKEILGLIFCIFGIIIICKG